MKPAGAVNWGEREDRRGQKLGCENECSTHFPHSLGDGGGGANLNDGWTLTHTHTCLDRHSAAAQSWKTCKNDAKLLRKEAKREWPVKVKAFKKGYKMMRQDQELGVKICLYHFVLKMKTPAFQHLCIWNKLAPPSSGKCEHVIGNM